MKKAQRAAAFLLTAILLLSGCRAVSPQSESMPDSQPPSAAEQAPAASEQSPAGLHMVTTDSEGSAISMGDENGYYYVDRGYGIDANLRYIDYASAQDIYLSSRPEADHLAPEDDSYIPSVAGDGRVFPAGGSLFLLRTGAPGELGNDALAAVFRMEPSGANRTQIYLGGADERLCSTAAADDTFLYLIREKTQTADGAPALMRTLIRMDQKTGAAEELCALTDNAYMIGAADGMLVFRSVFVSSDAQGAPVFQHEVLGYDLASGSLSVLQAWPQEESAGTWVYEELLITGSWASRTVTVRRLRESEVSATYQFPDNAPADWTGFWYAGCHDGRFYFHIGPALSVLDLTTGAWSEMTLQYDDSEKLEARPVQIYAETSSQFLVVCDEDTTPHHFIYQDDHTPYETEIPQPVFALISKADYWASVPNYTPVTFNG